MDRGVFVLGMHRSGTSVAARLINMLGVPICAPEDLLPPRNENPTGYWESATLVESNDRLLETLGGDWSAPPTLEPGWERSPSLEETRAEAHELFRGVFPGDVWVWKDPRNCLLLPFWLECLDVQPVVVLVVRNPVEIASSLAARGLSKVYSLALWERYLRTCLAAIVGRRVLVTGYDDLLADPCGWSEVAREFLLASGLDTVSAPEESVLGYVDRSLRHSAASREEVVDGLTATDEQKRLFLALEGARGAHDTFAAPPLPPEPPTTDALLEERRRAIARDAELGARLASLEERYASAETELAEARGTLEMREAELMAALEARSRDASKMRLREQKLEQRIAEVSEELDRALGSRGWRLLEHARRLLKLMHFGGEPRESTNLSAETSKSSLSDGLRHTIRLLRPFLPATTRQYLNVHFPGLVSSLRPYMDDSSEVLTVDDLISAEFPQLRPMSLFPGPSTTRIRLTVVTDSLSPGSLFGGVGTALVLAAILARRIDASLRVVTRTERPEPTGFSEVLSAAGVHWNDDVEFLYSPISADTAAVPVTSDDIFLTTSWWTTWASLRALAPSRIVYLLQEDERLFYPAGDEQVICTDVLSHPALMFVVNTSLLYEHLVAEGFEAIAANGVVFEPAFPQSIYFHEPRPEDARNRFFFYARPTNRRNLFVRGLEAINRAVASGILVPEEWDFEFVGRDIPPVALGGGVIPRRSENLAWRRYVELVRSVDVGLSLMETPHPGYPSLDLAACGAVAVTNRFGVKQSLDRYSANILCADTSAESLTRTIGEAVELARDRTRRLHNYQSQSLSRSWTDSLSPAVDWLADRL